MIAIVGKASPNESTGDIEYFLPNFAQMLKGQGRFAYAWSFNPDENAVALVRQSLDQHDAVYLYLPGEGGQSSLRMRVAGFHHDRNVHGTSCPPDWADYCIDELKGVCAFETPPSPIHVWFLINAIERPPQPVDLRTAFAPVFKDKYTIWGQNFFAFLHD